jgi:carotenoid 1,2-hydratase
MIGSVFSPYYAWARRRGTADPLDHCGLNIALYGGTGKRWSLTERGRSALMRDTSSLAIGPSVMSWGQDALTIEIEEITMPIPRKLRGRIRLFPEALVDYQAPLDATGRHRWTPLAPCARVEVAMSHPDLSWSGPAYFDANAGDEPLEVAFHGWDWSRAPHRGGTTVLYHVEPRQDGGDRESTGAAGANLALHFDVQGAVREFEAPGRVQLPRTRVWRIPRGTRADPNPPATVIATLEDTPFYARSVVASRLEGEQVTAVHESLSLDRFRQPWVRMLLPFRMPRASFGLGS